MRQLPLTHVENCAEWFSEAAEAGGAAGEILNVFDSERISAWRYGREWAARSGTDARLVPIPWVGAMGLAGLSSLANGSCSRGVERFPVLCR